MTDTQLLQEFETLAARMDIHVTHASIEDGPGGYCIIRGERRFILDRSIDVRTQVEIFAREFARLPLDDVFVLPRLRDCIDSYRVAEVLSSIHPLVSHTESPFLPQHSS